MSRRAWAPDYEDHDFGLDVTRHERIRLVLGYALATLVVIAFVLVCSLPGQS